jgi:scyllo-inositol 2-dehydrogenase (NADP+)
MSTFAATWHDPHVDQGIPRAITWGVIGSGSAANRFCSGLVCVRGTALDAVWSRNRKSANLLAEQTKSTACENIEDLLRRPIDAVYVSTLPDSHAQYSLAALQAGKHVLCEKPAMLNVDQLVKVLQVARQHNLLFMEAIKSPFYPLYRQLRQHLHEDPIGDVRFVRAGYATADVPSTHPSWRLDTGGGGLMGIGVYQVFLAVDWLGEAQSMHAFGRMGHDGVDTFASLQTQHVNGFAQLFSGLDLSGPGDAVLVGSEGYAMIYENWWNPLRSTIRYRDGRVIELNEPIVGGGFNYEIEHFCELIRLGKTESPVITHEKSKQIARILDYARRSVGVSF